jgi:hypothetical protein
MAGEQKEDGMRWAMMLVALGLVAAAAVGGW